VSAPPRLPWAAIAFTRTSRGGRAFDNFTPNEVSFIAQRDSFYMATVSETGWPYVQHRGGPRGFLKVVDEKTLAFADYRGNRQYISVGNLAADDRAALILMSMPAVPVSRSTRTSRRCRSTPTLLLHNW
jgi:predicted pyridoxine 5'-phosphate oxidase superfamily flavin-nucleotide-binding protein